ncbi:MAG: ArsR family transcriptional regulator [Promethearchaeota archaeon]
MSEYSNLISELSNPIRIKILFMLNEKATTLTDIAEKLGNISKSEVSRHLSRLMKYGFIQKKLPSGRKYEISPFGKVVISIFRPINFIFQYSKYFKTHQIDDLPMHLIREIDAIKDCEFVSGTGEVMFKIKEFQKTPAEERWVMIAEAFPFESVSAKKVNYIFVPEILKREGPTRKKHFKTQYRVRILENITIALALNSLGQGLICFPKTGDDKPDYTEGIIIKDVNGIDFLKKLWEHFWSKGKVYA